MLFFAAHAISPKTLIIVLLLAVVCPLLGFITIAIIYPLLCKHCRPDNQHAHNEQDVESSTSNYILYYLSIYQCIFYCQWAVFTNVLVSSKFVENIVVSLDSPDSFIEYHNLT